MNKIIRHITFALALVLAIPFSSNIFAETVTYNATISKLYISAGGHLQVYDIYGARNPADCPEIDRYFFLNDDEEAFNRSYAMLLATWANNSHDGRFKILVEVRDDTCAWDRPLIDSFIVIDNETNLLL